MLSGMVILSILCPVFALPTALYGMTKNSEYWKMFSFLYALFFASIAYNYYPVTNSDLTRYLSIITTYTGKPFSYALKVDRSNLYIQDLWFWLIAQTKDYQLIPAMSTFGVYFTGAYISNYISYKEKNNKFAVWQLLMLFCCIDLTIVINYVRNILAFALIVLGFFRWSVEKKRNIFTILLLILPIGLHSVAILFVLLILMIPLMEYSKWICFIIAFFSGFFVNFAYSSLYSIISNKLFKGIILKAYKYFNNEVATEWAIQVANNFMSKLVKFYNISLVIVCMILFLITQKRKKKCREQVENSTQLYDGIYLFNNYIFLIGIVTLGSTLVMAPIYRRFYTVFMLGSACILNRNLKTNKTIKMLYIYSFIGIVKWIYTICYEANLLRLLGIFISNPIFILINIIMKKIGV